MIKLNTIDESQDDITITKKNKKINCYSNYTDYNKSIVTNDIKDRYMFLECNTKTNICKKVKDTKHKLYICDDDVNKFDIIIIGGGPVGLLLAILLSDNTKYNFKIAVIEHRAEYTRRQILLINKLNYEMYSKYIQRYSNNTDIIDAPICYVLPPPSQILPICYKKNIISDDYSDEIVTLFYSIQTSILEKILTLQIKQHNQEFEHKLKDTYFNKIYIIKPDKGKFKVYINKLNFNVKIISDHNKIKYNYNEYDVLDLQTSKYLIGTEGYRSLVRKHITCSNPSDLCLTKYKNQAIGIYFIFNFKQYTDFFNKEIKDTSLKEMRTNQFTESQNKSRIFVTIDGYIYYGLLISELAYKEVYNKLYPDQAIDIQHIKNIKIQKNEDFNKIKDTHILLSLMLDMLNRDLINKLDISEKTIITSLQEVSIFDATPYEINPNKLYKKSGDRCAIIVGDSTLGVHFFSGTGVNVGFNMAQKVANILEHDTPDFKSYTQYYKDEIIPILLKSKNIADNL